MSSKEKKRCIDGDDNGVPNVSVEDTAADVPCDITDQLPPPLPPDPRNDSNAHVSLSACNGGGGVIEDDDKGNGLATTSPPGDDANVHPVALSPRAGVSPNAVGGSELGEVDDVRGRISTCGGLSVGGSGNVGRQMSAARPSQERGLTPQEKAKFILESGFLQQFPLMTGKRLQQKQPSSDSNDVPQLARGATEIPSSQHGDAPFGSSLKTMCSPSARKLPAPSLRPVPQATHAAPKSPISQHGVALFGSPLETLYRSCIEHSKQPAHVSKEVHQHTRVTTEGPISQHGVALFGSPLESLYKSML